ncbi:MAG TPA: alpha-amylase family glycosyl hydrolase [Solirubrobacteraceae bacterium]|nr:alpha-amylase family glycosyl hydrolase [Solirubrobacteraceae bacterium]
MVAIRALVALIAALFVASAAPAWAHGDREAHHSLREAVTDQNFYFVMADRFENGDNRNDLGDTSEGPSGFDPTGRGWYHGGDLKGLRDRLPYIKRLGTTAIWLTPSFKNKAVQPQDNSAGYHGYWITDFMQIDPHLGSNDDLAALVAAAHRLGMKVYFDIITNHTADVIGYAEGRRMPYVSKDAAPYRTAAGTVFDDRDFAGTGRFPALDPAVSFPYTPTVAAGEPTKNPAWLNDVTLYHNRGDTTFTGENSQYGDFFGLDDLFTENPRVVNGMIDIYKFWIRKFRVDGFRMDTMKHVDDAFWQRFAPEIERYARSQGIRDFYMFGEVAEDFDVGITSHYPIHDDVQGVLDFLFQMSAVDFAAKSLPTDALRDFFLKDDWYTDGDSNVYNLPTFLGNHDRGRIGMFIRNANTGADDDEVLRRDRLAHALMYFSRGNPVVYYGDEQGFVGDGGDQLARQDMFPSQVPEYNDDDLIGTDATTAEANFDTSHPLYRRLKRLARVTERHPTLRNGAQQHRYATDEAGIYAFSRVGEREYVVALNNAESRASASIPTYMRWTKWEKVFGRGPDRAWSGWDRKLDVTLPALSAVVYRAKDRLPRSRHAPSISLDVPATGRDRLEVGAELGSDEFAEVTFLAKSGKGGWHDIGTDDNAPYRVFHDVSDIAPGTRVQYRAVVLDNAGHTRSSGVRSATISQPALTLVKPNDGSNVRGGADLEASVVPEHASDVVVFERRIGSGAWTTVYRDDSSPAYTFHDTFSTDLDTGTQISYRATLNGKVVSNVRTVRVQKETLAVATVHYNRPAGDYGTPPDGWGLHMWGDAVDPAVLATIAWDKPFQRTGTDAYGAVYEIPLVNDTAAVNFIMHLPSGDSVPLTREPGGDRSFVPLDHPQIWLRQGDATVYFSQPPP